MQNVNIETGVHFGYISASSLDSEIVNSLLFYNLDSVNHTWNDWIKEQENENRKKWENGDSDATNPETFDATYLADDYYAEEEIISGIYQGVKYITSWLGGALNFFILESPVTDFYNVCSMCVPNAGNLKDKDSGGVLSYTIPEDWHNQYA